MAILPTNFTVNIYRNVGMKFIFEKGTILYTRPPIHFRNRPLAKVKKP